MTFLLIINGLLIIRGLKVEIIVSSGMGCSQI